MSMAPDKATPVYGEPTWAIARLFPTQGHWSEQEYLDLQGNRLVEFADGFIEVLPMPTMSHQEIMLFLYEVLKGFVATRHLGKVLVAALPMRLRTGKYREPDVLFMKVEHAHRMQEQFWDGADLVMEVLSEDRRHDLETKRAEYAEAGIPEYWIVDPAMRRITVLALEGDVYATVGEFVPGQVAESRLLPGFVVDVAQALAPALVD